MSLSWPFSWMRTKVDANNSIKQQSYLPPDSLMTWYLALETGNFWFPAQVYNREVSMIMNPFVLFGIENLYSFMLVGMKRKFIIKLGKDLTDSA